MADNTRAIAQDQLFYPWGQTWTMAGTGQETRFAGLRHRDTEAGLDPTYFRMFSSTQGRWFSTDPVSGQPRDPQTLNLYAYVGGNPTNRTDPRGDQCCDPYFGCYYFSYFFSGSITISFQCPDNRDSCCPYYDNLAADPRANFAERFYASNIAGPICSKFTGSDCLENCVRSCLVSYSQTNCDNLPDSSSRLYCREVKAHESCLLDCAFWAFVPGFFSGDPHITIPVPYPIYINALVTVPYACSSTNVGGSI